jgi:acyl-CoA dehydrogenase
MTATTPVTTAPDREELDLVRSLTREVLSSLDPTAAEAGRQAWDVLSGSDLVLVSLREEDGGSGGSLLDAAAVLAAVAESGFSLPLVETTWLAGWVASTHGYAAPAGPTSFVVAEGLTARPSGEGWQLDGTVTVPWGGSVEELHLLLPVNGAVAVVHLDASRDWVTTGVPRREVQVTTHVPADRWRPLAGPVEPVLAGLRLRAALARTVQVSGALVSSLDLAVRHAGERVQFGRPLSANQVLQHYLAKVADLAHGVAVATDAAVAAVASGEPDAGVAVHAAKAVASLAVDEATELVHQVLGAIGTTLEHPLHRRTLSLWAWRDDAGSEVEHAAALGRLLLEGGDAWSALVPVRR